MVRELWPRNEEKNKSFLYEKTHAIHEWNLLMKKYGIWNTPFYVKGSQDTKITNMRTSQSGHYLQSYAAPTLLELVFQRHRILYGCWERSVSVLGCERQHTISYSRVTATSNQQHPTSGPCVSLDASKSLWGQVGSRWNGAGRGGIGRRPGWKEGAEWGLKEWHINSGTADILPPLPSLDPSSKVSDMHHLHCWCWSQQTHSGARGLAPDKETNIILIRAPPPQQVIGHIPVAWLHPWGKEWIGLGCKWGKNKWDRK